MAVAISGGEITVSGNEDSLNNLHTPGVPLSQGALRVETGNDPLRRLVLLVTARILLTGTLSWDTVVDSLTISGSAPNGSGSVPATDYAAPGAGGAIEVRKGGHLNIGAVDNTGADGPVYSKGDVVIAKKGNNASDVASAAILGLPGSSISLRGVTMKLAAAFRMDGARTSVPANPAVDGAACVFRANDVVMHVVPKSTTGYFAPRLFTDDYQIDGWHQIGGVIQIQARKTGSFIRNIKLEKMQGGLGVTGNSFGTETDFLDIEGVDGNHNSAIDINMFNGMKVRIYNSATGTLLKVDLQARNHPGRSYGVAELRQKVRVIVKGTDGVPIVGARVHYEDFVTGRGHVNWTQKNVGVNQSGSPSTAVDYVTQRDESVLSVLGGNADLDVLIANMVYNARPASGQTLTKLAWALRGQTNVLGDDIMPVHVHSYRHLAALIPVICQGLTRLEVEASLVLDPSVTELNEATVAAYVGIAIDHATNTITITAAINLDMVYDFAKHDKQLAGSEIHPTRAGMLANADGTIIDLGAYNVAVNAGGRLTPGTKFRSIRTTGTVTTAGTGHIDIGYQDSAGKSILIRYGAAQTAAVYRTAHDGAKTWLQPTLAASERITVPPASTVEMVIKRVGTFYKRFSIPAVSAAEIDADLVTNPSINTAAIVDGINVLHWRDDPHGNYAGNMYVEQRAAPLTNVLRLGNVTLTGSPAITRALVDRRMTTRSAMEATLDHDDTARGPAYEIRVDRMLRDEQWLDIDRQPLTVPPNPAQGDGTAPGTLQKLASFGLFVVNRDGITPYIPRVVGDFFVTIDPAGVYPNIPARDILAINEAFATNAAVQTGIADRVESTIRPRFDSIDRDNAALSRQLADLPIDDLLTIRTSRHVVPLGGAHIFTGEGAWSLVGGHWQFDYDGPTADSDPVSTLNAEGVVAFDIGAPATDDYVLEITVQAQALTGPARDIDPGVQTEWVCGAGTQISVRRIMGFITPSHPVRVHATVGALGPPVTIRYNIGHPADNINITDFAIDLNPRVHGADDHLRIVVTRLEWASSHPATLNDFRADLTALENRVTAARMAHLDADVSSRMAAADYVAPPAAADLTDITNDLTTLLARVTAARMAHLDADVSSRATAANIPAAPDLTDITDNIATLLARVTAIRAGYLDRLDATVSSRLAAADYVAPPAAVTPEPEREILIPELVHGAPHNPARVSDADVAPGGTYLSGNFSNTYRAVWRVPSVHPDQHPRLRAAIQLKRNDGTDPHAGFPWPHDTTLDLYIGQGLDGANDNGGTRILRHHLARDAVVQTPPDAIDLTAAARTEQFDSVMLVLRTGPTNLNVRGYLWDLAIELDALRYVVDLTRDNLDAAVSTRLPTTSYTAPVDVSADVAAAKTAAETLEARVTAAAIDHLDADVSSRAAAADIPTASIDAIKVAIVPLVNRLSQAVVDEIVADAKLSRQLMANKYSWTPDQFIIYDDDDVTVLKTYTRTGTPDAGTRDPI